MDCLNWHILFGDPIESCYASFVVPQLRDNPKLLREYAKQFMASSSAKNYVAAYKDECAALFMDKGRTVRKTQESDEDFNTRRKRESVEKVMVKITDMVDHIEDAETLLDTIKAMKDTGYFDSSVKTLPPGRYLPVCCIECEYKKFVDKHVKTGDIEEVKEDAKAEKEESGF